MANYAIVENNKVINTCAWDGIAHWQPPAGSVAVEIPEGIVAGVGYSYVDGQFIAPAPIETVEQPEEDLLASLTTEQKQALIAMLKSE